MLLKVVIVIPGFAGKIKRIYGDHILPQFDIWGPAFYTLFRKEADPFPAPRSGRTVDISP
jgi:hypothetical protein